MNRREFVYATALGTALQLRVPTELFDCGTSLVAQLPHNW